LNLYSVLHLSLKVNFQLLEDCEFQELNFNAKFLFVEFSILMENHISSYQNHQHK
jgi:hypothetical protein